MKTFLSSMMCVAIVACGGASGTGLGDGGADAANDSTTGTDGSGNDASNDVNGDGPACPNEQGRYSVTFTGQGCGPTSTNTPICIQQTACMITISTPGGGANELSTPNPVSVGSDGSFSGAAVDEGTMARTGCVATWDSGTSTLTIDCGGMSVSQGCMATLVRTAPGCT